MFDNPGSQAGAQVPSLNPQLNPFGNTFSGTGSGLIRGGLGAYGEKILGSSSEYVQSNISRYFSDPQYYFQVNDQYVKNKLKVILFPFLHRGHWTRIIEPVGGRLSYKPPIYDINAPDLYIPLMAFVTYVVLAGFSLGLLGKSRVIGHILPTFEQIVERTQIYESDWPGLQRAHDLRGDLKRKAPSGSLQQQRHRPQFSPEALSLQFTKGLLGWFLQVALLKVLLYSLGSGEAPLLDIIAYAGYAFTGMSVAVLAWIFWSYAYYFMMPWMCICMAVFLVKTVKRVLFAEVRSHDKYSSIHHYLLLFMAVSQFPLFFWLGNVGS